MKINKSQIARELEVDRRTVDKYINGYTKSKTRNCGDCITPYYDIISELLSDSNQQIFYYRKVSNLTTVKRAMSKERLISGGFYDLATAYQSVHVNY